MTAITLDTPVVVVPAQEAVTASSFEVLYIEENYGKEISEEGGPRFMGPGQHSSVNAEVLVGAEPGPVVRRRITVWEGDAYLAVRGTWTDQDLYNKIKEILQAGN